MKAIIEPKTLSFLQDLKSNNNRDWFKQNKNRYEEARANVIIFVGELIQSIAKWDASISHHTAKSVLFRIYRDVRFSADKSPYKTHFGAHISSAAKRSDIHSRAGYYVHIGPGDTMLAGGAYMPQSAWLKSIRHSIDTDPGDLKKIIASASFKKHFGELEGDQLKTAPKGYPKDHPEVALLRYKSFLATHHCTDDEVLQSDFLKHATKVFKALYPLDVFLNRHIS